MTGPSPSGAGAAPTKPRGPRLYVILDRTVAGGRDLVAILEAAIEGGAEMIQLREKTWPSGQVYPLAQRLRARCGAASVPFIVNDRVDLAVAVEADGVHLGQDDLPPEAARKLLGRAAIIGFSTHDLEQAFEASTLPINYLAIGPIFETGTKANPDPAVGIEGIRTVRSVVGDLTLVAIGGITAENAREVLAAGADSVAVISALVSDADAITRRTANLIRHLRNRTPD